MENPSQNNPQHSCSMASCTAGQGRLPACAPLANPFVPFQPMGAAQYEPPKGLIRGTLFPGLDLPFMGMVNNQEKTGALAQLQALHFAIVELGEYLDTHAEDEEALSLFRHYAEQYQEDAAAYEKQFGPLTQMQVGTDQAVYEWIQDPWPWDGAEQEG